MDNAIRQDNGQPISFRQWLAMPASQRPAVICAGLDPNDKPCRQPARARALNSTMQRPHWAAVHIKDCNHGSRVTSENKPARVKGTRVQNRHDGPAIYRIHTATVDTEPSDNRTSTYLSATGQATRRESYSTGGGKKQAAEHTYQLRSLLRDYAAGSIQPDALIELPGQPARPARDLIVHARNIQKAPVNKPRLFYGKVANVRMSDRTYSHFLNFAQGGGSIMVRQFEMDAPGMPPALADLKGAHVIAWGWARNGSHNIYVQLDDPVLFAYLPPERAHR